MTCGHQEQRKVILLSPVTLSLPHENLSLWFWRHLGSKKTARLRILRRHSKKIAQEWGISQKVVVIVADNAANVVANVRHTGWTHVPCFVHTLNLVVSEAIEADTKIHQLRKSCRDIVSFFHHSVKASES